MVAPGWPADEVAASPLKVTVFQELIAPTADRVADAVELAKSHLNASPLSQSERGETLRLGLSPHAPYSVHPALLSATIELSKENRIPIAMHLAESREELELLQRGGGPLRASGRTRGLGLGGDPARHAATGLLAAARVRR